MMSELTTVRADEGLYFGLGAFETIELFEGQTLLLERHLRRLEKALAFLGIAYEEELLRQRVREGAEAAEPAIANHGALKLLVTSENVMVSTRANPYGPAERDRGFSCCMSAVRRNETSPLVVHKTLNYGDNILEKRRALRDGFNEPLFLNTRGELAEGATTNVFIMKDGQLVTPPVASGLLPGIARELLLDRLDVREEVLTMDDLLAADEVFLTNSLMGVMPVREIDGAPTHSMDRGRELAETFRQLALAESAR